jgi:hypothetical protein
MKYKANESTATKTGLAKVAAQYSRDTYMDNQTLVLRINIYFENRHFRQAQERKRTAFSCLAFTHKTIVLAASLFIGLSNSQSVNIIIINSLSIFYFNFHF